MHIECFWAGEVFLNRRQKFVNIVARDRVNSTLIILQWFDNSDYVTDVIYIRGHGSRMNIIIVSSSSNCGPLLLEVITLLPRLGLPMADRSRTLLQSFFYKKNCSPNVCRLNVLSHRRPAVGVYCPCCNL